MISTQVFSIQIRAVTFIIPPSSMELDCTIAYMYVIVFIFGWKSITTVVLQWISWKEGMILKKCQYHTHITAKTS